MLAAVRSYIKEYHKEWDEKIHQISSGVKNVKHDSTGFSPHYLVFGTHKINHASDYELHRLLLSDTYCCLDVHHKSDKNRIDLGPHPSLFRKCTYQKCKNIKFT